MAQVFFWREIAYLITLCPFQKTVTLVVFSTKLFEIKSLIFFSSDPMTCFACASARQGVIK